MKKVFFAVISLATTFSCGSNIKQTETVYKVKGRSIFLYEIDSCEYIGGVTPAASDILTHTKATVNFV